MRKAALDKQKIALKIIPTDLDILFEINDI